MNPSLVERCHSTPHWWVPWMVTTISKGLSGSNSLKFNGDYILPHKLWINSSRTSSTISTSLMMLTEVWQQKYSQLTRVHTLQSGPRQRRWSDWWARCLCDLHRLVVGCHGWHNQRHVQHHFWNWDICFSMSAWHHMEIVDMMKSGELWVFYLFIDQTICYIP